MQQFINIGKNAYNKFYLLESKIILAGFEFQIGFVGFCKSAFKDAVKNAKFLSFLKSSSYIESDWAEMFLFIKIQSLCAEKKYFRIEHFDQDQKVEVVVAMFLIILAFIIKWHFYISIIHTYSNIHS